MDGAESRPEKERDEEVSLGSSRGRGRRDFRQLGERGCCKVSTRASVGRAFLAPLAWRQTRCAVGAGLQSRQGKTSERMKPASEASSLVYCIGLRPFFLAVVQSLGDHSRRVWTSNRVLAAELCRLVMPRG